MGALSNQLWLQPLLRIVQEAGQLPQGQDQQRLKSPLHLEQFPAWSQGVSGLQNGPRGKRYQRGGAHWVGG